MAPKERRPRAPASKTDRGSAKDPGSWVENETRLNEILENTPAGYFFIDRDGHFQRVNRAWLRMHGYASADEVIGRHFSLTQVDPDLEKAQRNVATLLAGETMATGEFSRRCRDGSIGYHSFSAHPVIRHGETIGLEGFLIDLTERRRAEESLRESENRTKAMLWAIPDLVFRLDRNGVFLDFKADSQDLYAQARPTIIGQRNRDITPPDFGHLIDEKIRITLETRTLQTFEYQLPIPSRGMRDYEARMVASGKDEVTAIVRDVTEQKRVEAALRKSEEKFRHLFEEMVSGFALHELVTDADGNPIDYITLDVNKEYERLLQVPGEAVIGKRAYETVPDLDREWLRIFGQVVVTGEPCKYTQFAPNLDKWFEGTAFRPGPGQFAVTFVDITERKKAEEALNRERDRAQSYLDTVETIIVALDTEGRITTINRKGCQIFGWERERLLGKNWFSTCLPRSEKFDTVFSTFRQLVSGEIQALEYVENPIATRSGEVRQIAWHNALLHDDQGRIIGTLSSGQDITEQNKAEEELRESETRFRSLVESAPEAVFVQCAGRFVYVNSATVQLLGAEKPENLLGRDIMDRMAPEFHSAIRERIRLQCETGKAVPLMEQEYLRLDGSRVPVETTAVPIRFKGRDAHLVFVRNITERKRAEDALLRQTALLEAQVNSSIDGILVVDSQGRKILQNQRTVELWKIPQPIADAVDDAPQIQHVMSLTKYPEEFLAKVAYLYQHPTAISRDEIELTDGTVLDRHSAPVVGKDGQHFGRVWTFRDITERKRTEESLRHSNERLQALAAQLQSVREEEKSRVSQQIHDELGQILTASKMASFQVLAWMEKPSNGASEAILAKARESIHLHEEAISAVRSIARELRPSLITDLGLLAAIEWQIGNFQERSGLMCDLSVSCRSMVFPPEEGNNIFRILQEALTNILKHAQATKVVVRLSRRNGQFQMTIQDNGVGCGPLKLNSSQSLGIIGMLERAHHLGGTLEVIHHPLPSRKGTLVRLRIPNRKKS